MLEKEGKIQLKERRIKEKKEIRIETNEREADKYRKTNETKINKRNQLLKLAITWIKC